MTDFTAPGMPKGDHYLQITFAHPNSDTGVRFHSEIRRLVATYFPGAKIESHYAEDETSSWKGTPEDSVKVSAYEPTLGTNLEALPTALRIILRRYHEEAAHLVYSTPANGTFVGLIYATENP